MVFFYSYIVRIAFTFLSNNSYGHDFSPSNYFLRMLNRANHLAGFFLIILSCAIGALPGISHGTTMDKLSEDNIRAFIQKTSTITAGRESIMSQEEIDAYLNKHIDEQARFKSTMRYTIPGFEVQENAMSVSKKDFIESINKATETVSDYESLVEISDIKISKDGRKATVQTRTQESGVMPVTDNIELENVPMQGSSTCTQILTLNEKNVIQMFGASCVTDIAFDTFAP